MTVFAPPQPDDENVKPATLARRERERAREPEVVKAWRAQMAGEEAEAAMRRRSRIELVNAQTKNRGLGDMLVRGLRKVEAVAWLQALAHNLRAARYLRAASAAA